MLKRLITELIILANLFNFYCFSNKVIYKETLDDVAGKFSIEHANPVKDEKYVKAAELMEEHGNLNKKYMPVSYTAKDTLKLEIIQYVREFEFEKKYKLLFYNSKESKKSIFEKGLSAYQKRDHFEIGIIADTSLILVEDYLNGKLIGYIKRLNGRNIEFSENTKYQELFDELFDRAYQRLKLLKIINKN